MNTLGKSLAARYVRAFLKGVESRTVSETEWTRDSEDKLYLVSPPEYGSPSNITVHLSPSMEIEVLPVHEPPSLHCEYWERRVETAPTCSQCGAPLRNPTDDMPRYAIKGLTNWKI